MAIKHICDGCNKPIDDAPHQIGHVVQRDYCDDCATIAREYMEQLDIVHTKAANVFNAGIVAQREKYSGQIAALPDYNPPDEDA